MDSYWESFELALDAYRCAVINGVMVDWCGGRVSGMAASGMHMQKMSPEEFEFFMDIRRAWECYAFEQSLKRSAA